MDIYKEFNVPASAPIFYSCRLPFLKSFYNLLRGIILHDNAICIYILPLLVLHIILYSVNSADKTLIPTTSISATWTETILAEFTAVLTSSHATQRTVFAIIFYFLFVSVSV